MAQGRYPQSWYPVARGCDLKPGRHVIVKAFDAEWLLFRTHTGHVGMTSRHCCHMGADLAQGRVRGETIECPLHGWLYTIDGKCARIPARGKPPGDNVRLPALFCREDYGVIFAFWGERPTFDLPLPPYMDFELACSKPHTLDIATEYHTPSLNTFDIHHFERIHARRFTTAPDITYVNRFQLRIDYEAEILKRRWVDHIMLLFGSPRTRVTIDCWGSSMLLLVNQDTRFGGLVAMVPVESGHSRVFIVACRAREEKSTLSTHMKNSVLSGAAAFLMRGFLKPDLKAITHMRPFRGYWLDDLDAGAQRYWDYWQQLPRWNGPSTTFDYT